MAAWVRLASTVCAAAVKIVSALWVGGALEGKLHADSVIVNSAIRLNDLLLFMAISSL